LYFTYALLYCNRFYIGYGVYRIFASSQRVDPEAKARVTRARNGERESSVSDADNAQQRERVPAIEIDTTYLSLM